MAAAAAATFCDSGKSELLQSSGTSARGCGHGLAKACEAVGLARKGKVMFEMGLGLCVLILDIENEFALKFSSYLQRHHLNVELGFFLQSEQHHLGGTNA